MEQIFQNIYEPDWQFLFNVSSNALKLHNRQMKILPNNKMLVRFLDINKTK